MHLYLFRARSTPIIALNKFQKKFFFSKNLKKIFWNTFSTYMSISSLRSFFLYVKKIHIFFFSFWFTMRVKYGWYLDIYQWGVFVNVCVFHTFFAKWIKLKKFIRGRGRGLERCLLILVKQLLNYISQTTTRPN